VVTIHPDGPTVTTLVEATDEHARVSLPIPSPQGRFVVLCLTRFGLESRRCARHDLRAGAALPIDPPPGTYVDTVHAALDDGGVVASIRRHPAAPPELLSVAADGTAHVLDAGVGPGTWIDATTLTVTGGRVIARIDGDDIDPYLVEGPLPAGPLSRLPTRGSQVGWIDPTPARLFYLYVDPANAPGRVGSSPLPPRRGAGGAEDRIDWFSSCPAPPETATT
jgi:hypothetical protein